MAEENARRESERLAREQEGVRLELEEDRRREEAEREREHAARLEAIRQAEIERARVEAEQRGRLEALSAQQQHEQKLAALKSDAGKKRLSRVLRLTLGLSTVLIVGAVALYFGRLRPETRNEVRSLESLIQGQRQQTEATQRALDAQNLKLQDLEERVRKEREQQRRNEARAARNRSPRRPEFRTNAASNRSLRRRLALAIRTIHCAGVSSAETIRA